MKREMGGKKRRRKKKPQTNNCQITKLKAPMFRFFGRRDERLFPLSITATPCTTVNYVCKRWWIALLCCGLIPFFIFVLINYSWLVDLTFSLAFSLYLNVFKFPYLSQLTIGTETNYWHSHRQFRAANHPNVYVSGLWEENRGSRGNLHEKNMLTRHRMFLWLTWELCQCWNMLQVQSHTQCTT